MTNFIERINTKLGELISSDTKLHEAMRYVLLAGGKRIRPLLVYHIGTALDAPIEALDNAACAVECIHAYSLVHDDLPAMDNDDLRRGKPTCHKAYDEATAILVGDALQALAFELIANDNHLTTDIRINMLTALTHAVGSHGMAGGQAIDLESNITTVEQLEQLHSMKTGTLIKVSALLGAIAADADDKTLQHCCLFANKLGLAFQIQDDILDVESNTETLGKTAGKDQQQNKVTYPDLLGIEQAKALAESLYQQASCELATINLETALTPMIHTILHRQS